MHKILLAAAGAAILTCSAMVTRSDAMPIGAAVRPAAEAINPVEKTACWRPGWGWYPCGYYWRPRYAWGPGYYWGPRHFWGPRRFYGFHRHWG
ncbi:MAG TPA: hypothetical protein VK281_06600 [Xanthobacteraceae bacterium]|nr:hypothetical protein [Xanthobacteraceae bacterium]